MKTPIVKICPVCGKEFYVKTSHAERRVCCSKTCAGILHSIRKTGKGKQPIEKMCLGCKQLFKTKNENQRYCSSICWVKSRPHPRDESKKETKQCPICGKSFTNWISQKQKYCSDKCRNVGHKQFSGLLAPRWRGGIRKWRGPNWDTQRKKAIKRDGSCRLCGTTKHLHVHHIIPWHTFDGNYMMANVLTNLVTLCRKCHNKVEHGYPCPRPLF